MVVDGEHQRVAEHLLGLEVLVLQAHLKQRHGALVGVLVFGNSREVEVDKLHESLDVLGNRNAAERLYAVLELHGHVGLLAVESLLQFVVGEVAQSAGFDYGVEVLQVDKVFLSVYTLAAFGNGLELHLVLLEVGLLKYHAGTVGECQLGVAEGCIVLLRHNLAGFRHLGNQRFVLGLVHVSLNLLASHAFNGSCHVGFRVVGLAFLLLQGDESHEV